MKNINKVIEDLFHDVKNLEDKGAVASYIPELAKVNTTKFGIHLSTTSNTCYGIGDYLDKFSIQSIAKVLSLSLAIQFLGTRLWKRVGVEPSGSAFNSLIQLENEHGIPRNPFLNSGAIVICDILVSYLQNPKEDFIAYLQSISDNNSISYSPTVANSEKKMAYKNIAMCNFMKSFDNIKNDPEEVLDFYYHLCSIEMNCKELSDIFLFFANAGKKKDGLTEIISPSQTKRLNALMQTCGFYDESGEFAFRVGLPGKSGVGGGIIAIYPQQYSIAVWSPLLNTKGNSYKGMKFLEEFTTLTASIF